MSTTAPIHQMVTEHAIRVAQKLSPAMQQAMLKVDVNFLRDRRVPTGTAVALMRRELMGHVVRTAPAPKGRWVEVDNDYDEGNAGYGHLLTELGEAVLQVLVRGPEEALKRAIAADELPVERTENLHDVLIMTSHRQYRIVEGDVFQGSTPDRLVREADMICLEVADKAGLIEECVTAISKVKYLRLTKVGQRVLLAFDVKYGREGMPYSDGVPPREVLVAQPTKAVVAEWSEYYISGPGRLLAEKVGCGHGYRLTDSCAICP